MLHLLERRRRLSLLRCSTLLFCYLHLLHPSLLIGESRLLLLLLARVDSRALHGAMRTGSQVEDKLHIFEL